MTENSITRSSQLLPMRMDELLGNLLEIQSQNKSHDDCGFSSEESSEESLGDIESRDKKRKSTKKVKKTSGFSTSNSVNKGNRGALIVGKENTCDKSTAPLKDGKTTMSKPSEETDNSLKKIGKNEVVRSTPSSKLASLDLLKSTPTSKFNTNDIFKSTPRSNCIKTPLSTIQERIPSLKVTAATPLQIKERPILLHVQPVSNELTLRDNKNNLNIISESNASETIQSKNVYNSSNLSGVVPTDLNKAPQIYDNGIKCDRELKTIKEEINNSTDLVQQSKRIQESSQSSLLLNQMPFKSIFVKNRHFMVVKRLGVGGSSEVHKVLDTNSLNDYAVKIVKLNAEDQMLVSGYINEIKLLKTLQGSEYVVKMFDFEYCLKSSCLRVVLEVGETDFSSFLKARAPDRLPNEHILYYWREMLQAVQYIHTKGIIHADLKPANFLLVRGRLKLIDFGIASAVACDATSVIRSCAVGTFSYISPEALAGGAGTAVPNSDLPIKISFRSDVWSLGCILYSMLYGRTPFSHITNTYAKIATIVNPKHHIDFPDTDVPDALQKSLIWCLRYDARSRPFVNDLLAVDLLGMKRRPLPKSLLQRIAPHLKPNELKLLMNATVDLSVDLDMNHLHKIGI